MAAKYPNAEIGISLLNPVAMNDIHVVIEVVMIAFEVRLQVKFILLSNQSRFESPSTFNSLKVADCFHQSVNTNTSSAAIPKITKIAI